MHINKRLSFFILGGTLCVLTVASLLGAADSHAALDSAQGKSVTHLPGVAQAASPFLSNLLKVYMPRRMCMFYEGPVIWLHVISDMLIALSYYSIPFALIYFVRRRRDVAFGSVFWMFAAFILACGTTHFFGVLDIWRPYYRLDGIVKAITAAISIVTAIALWNLMPQLLAIPSAAKLEMMVRERTVELTNANADRERLLQAEREARAEAERQFRVFDTALSSIRDYTFILDRDGRFIYANKILLDLWGKSAKDAIGKSLTELEYPADAEAQIRKNIRQVYESGKVVTDGTPYTSPAGAQGHYEYILAPVLTADGSVELVAGSSRDVTERKHAEAERERLLASERAARTEAERANQLKDEFLSTLSHELRTPLNAILGWSQILCRTKITDPELLEGLTVIERNARAQTKLIAELLDMSRIISGKLKLEIQQMDLTSVVYAAIATVRPGIEAKGIHLACAVNGRIEPMRADPARIQQVFWNILTNSVKFTPNGGTINIALNQSGGQAQIVISDDGQGIAADFLPHIFERFRQADGSITRRHGGLGLGLAIVKSIVEAHGGTVTAQSPGEGQGATFTVNLPMASMQDGTSSAETPPAQNGSPGPLDRPIDRDRALRGVKVLIVDDEPDSVDFVAKVLKECDATVFAAGSSRQAWELLLGERPDLLISDIGMPGEDGYQLMKKIRSLPPEQGGNIPAAALSAYASPDDQARARNAGFALHLSKPIEPAELVAAAVQLAGKRSAP